MCVCVASTYPQFLTNDRNTRSNWAIKCHKKRITFSFILLLLLCALLRDKARQDTVRWCCCHFGSASCALRNKVILEKMLRWQMFNHDSLLLEQDTHQNTHHTFRNWQFPFGLISFLAMLFRQLIYNRWMWWCNLLSFNGMHSEDTPILYALNTPESRELLAHFSYYGGTVFCGWLTGSLAEQKLNENERMPNGVLIALRCLFCFAEETCHELHIRLDLVLCHILLSIYYLQHLSFASLLLSSTTKAMTVAAMCKQSS